MPFPIIAAAMGAAAGQMANTAAQSSMNKAESREWRKNQGYNFELSQEAQRNAARNMVEGYKMAGLSPALAAGGNFSPASMPSAPMQNKQAPQMDLASAVQAAKAAELSDAQQANLGEQTRSLKIENDRREQEDSNYNTIMVNTIEKWRDALPKDHSLRSVYDDILAEPDKFNKGSFNALKDATDFSAFVREAVARAEGANLRALIARKQSEDGIYKQLAQMPDAELQALYKEAALKVALAKNAEAQAKSEGEHLKKLQKEQSKLEAEAANIAEDTRRMRFGKYGNMYDHGDYGAAMAEIVGETAETTAKTAGEETVKLGADVIRAKTGTPHGLIRSESTHKGARSGSRETWKDRRGHTHEVYDEQAFPVGE